VRLAVERPALLRRVVVLRPPRFAVVRFAVPRLAVLRFAVARLAVVLRRLVVRFAVVLRPPAPVLARRRVVLRPPPDAEPLIGEGGGGVGLEGSGVGQPSRAPSARTNRCLRLPAWFLPKYRWSVRVMHIEFRFA